MSHWSKSKCVGFLTSWGIEWRTNYHHRTHIDWSGRTGRLKNPQYHPILRVWNALNPVWKSCVCMMPDINCAKRGTPTMRCAFHRLTPRLSNAVPTVGTRLLFWHLGWAKLQPLRNFWLQIDPSPATFPKFRGVKHKASPKLAPCLAAPHEGVRLQEEGLGFATTGQPHQTDWWFSLQGVAKLFIRLNFYLWFALFTQKCKPWVKIKSDEKFRDPL